MIFSTPRVMTGRSVMGFDRGGTGGSEVVLTLSRREDSYDCSGVFFSEVPDLLSDESTEKLFRFERSESDHSLLGNTSRCSERDLDLSS